MTKQFSGKVALVTGGSAGIGRAAAVAFAKEGAKVVIAARRDKESEAVLSEIKGTRSGLHDGTGSVAQYISETTGAPAAVVAKSTQPP